jgi:SlyX protein
MDSESVITRLQGRVDELQGWVEELQSRLAFQEDTLQVLHEQIAHQQRVTEQQQHMLQALYARLRDLQDAGGAEGAAPVSQEKPPHY